MISHALETALTSVKVDPRDQAAVALARLYAGRIDTDGDVTKLGPPLLAVLKELHMTPASRSSGTAPGGGGETDEPDDVDELEERRRLRNDPGQHDAKAVD